VETRGGKIGLVALLISGAGLIIAGIFKTDPITASEAQHTTTGALHSFGGGLGIAIPVAAILICIALRKNARWNSFKKPLLLASVVAIAGFLLGFVSLGVMMSTSEGKFGPNVLVGWPNRIEIICYCVWLLVVASQARRVNVSPN
jgi:hypothetical protein